MIQLGKNFIWYIKESNKNHLNIVFIGLDGSGKTTICNSLAGIPDRSVVPTVGFNKPKQFKVENFDVKLFDVGGSRAFRKQWTTRLTRCHAAIFVVDSSNTERLLEARDELANYSSQLNFRGKPVLVFANKQDAKGALNAEQVASALRLDCGALAYCSHNIVPCIGSKLANGGNVDKSLALGFDWLMNTVSKRWKELKLRVKVDTVELERLEAVQRAETSRLVAERKRLRQQQQKAASVVPADAKEQQQKKAETQVMCKNMLIVGDERVECNNQATVRNSTTEWMPFCDICHQSAIAKAAEDESAEGTEQPTPCIKPAGSVRSAANNSQHHNNQENQPSSSNLAFNSPPNTMMMSSNPKSPTKQLPPITFPKANLADLAGCTVVPQVSVASKKLDTSRRLGAFGEVPSNGDQVYASFHGKGKWYPGIVTEIDSETGVGLHFTVQYDDGDTERCVKPENICSKNAQPLQPGTRVLCKFRGKGKAYLGSVVARNDDGTYHVQYDDGDEDNSSLRWWIRGILSDTN